MKPSTMVRVQQFLPPQLIEDAKRHAAEQRISTWAEAVRVALRHWIATTQPSPQATGSLVLPGEQEEP